MHIEMFENMDNIRQCFENLKQLEELGIGTQITEFDMCLPERFMFDENGKISQEHSQEEIYKFKSEKIEEISEVIRKTGIRLDGITYWTVIDTLDHNLERTNTKTYKDNLQRAIASTRYSGLYSDLEKDKTVSVQRLGQETLEEQKNTTLLDKIEQVQLSQEQILTNDTKNIQEI